ncbi:hypothetical protein [Lysobacter gummosus]|uniref:hypothetical protein n=1 Tax=Lysobacter gummosus TaxID=262324 RepID=UPI0036387463
MLADIGFPGMDSRPGEQARRCANSSALWMTPTRQARPARREPRHAAGPGPALRFRPERPVRPAGCPESGRNRWPARRCDA